MERSRAHSVFFALAAIVLSAGSVANASVMAALPTTSSANSSNSSNGPQSIAQADRNQVRVKERLCESQKHPVERRIDAPQDVQTSATAALIELDVATRQAHRLLTSVRITTTVHPASQRTDALHNLPPPVR